MAQVRRLGVIPARGGSKRLPRKNVIDFFGKPIISYTIEAALEAAVFDRLLVSTEDEEIAAVACRFGASIAERPPSLAQDHSTVVEVCLDLLEGEAREGRVYDVLCCLYATAPLRRSADIKATVELVVPGHCDFALAVSRYGHYPHQALKFTESGFVEPVWPEYVTARAAMLGPMVVGNGSTYAASVEAFQQHRSFYGPKMRGHKMPMIRSVDIDDQEDLEIAHCFARNLGFGS